MTISEIVQECRDLLDLMPGDVLARARQKHPNVGALGVFPVYAPVEIIHAAGLLPVGMFGAGDKVELMQAESRFQSFICSIAKSTLELVLRGDLRDFEGVVFSSICDVARNLSSLAKRNAPDLYIEYLHMPQNMYSEQSADYARAEFERFRTNLSDHLGRPITDDAIATSLELYNKVRARVRDLYAHRQQKPCSIAASDLYALVRASTLMMPEDFLPLIETVCDELQTAEWHERDGVKIVIEGAFCEGPPIGLIEVLEGGGCLVQDDDLMVGWRLFENDIIANGDPLAAIAQAYLAKSHYTSVRHDRDQSRSKGLVKRMNKAGAEAVVFTPAKFCEPALLDYVLFRQELDDSGVPHLKLEFEEKMWTFDATRTEVETFVESMLFD